MILFSIGRWRVPDYDDAVLPRSGRGPNWVKRYGTVEIGLYSFIALSSTVIGAREPSGSTIDIELVIISSMSMGSTLQSITIKIKT